MTRAASALLLCAICVATRARLVAATPPDAKLFIDFEDGHLPPVRTFHGAKRVTGKFGTALQFTDAMQYAEVDAAHLLDGVTSATVGGWFLPRGAGEQAFLFRGVPQVGENGERLFPPRADWVNYLIGTDQHGFFLGAVHGNARMPFPRVTLNEVAIDSWSQLVVVKTGDGYQKFYRNGRLVHADTESAYAPLVRPFNDAADGEPLRLAMPLGGLVGEAWVVGRELTADEVKADFDAKREKYHPALPAEPVNLREMDAHPAAWLWKEPPTNENWPAQRRRILTGYEKIFGASPKEKVPLDPRTVSEEDCGSYVRRKVSIQVQQDDRMPAYVLVPKHIKGRAPAVVCFYGTTSGAGKDTTVGLSGGKPGTPPEKNRDYAVWMAEAGFVAFAGDYLRDGERVAPGRKPYDTTDFYQRFPDWSVHGKDAWDTSCAIDYLQSLDFVDGEKIGMIGHSYGGHSTIFTAAVEPRIKAAVANGPVSDFLHHGMHWAVPKGGGASQSLPAMRPYVLDPTTPPPVTFYEVTSLIAPRPLLVGQAVGERRTMEEENHAAVRQVYEALGAAEKVKYVWYPGDHDFPPAMRAAAVGWFKKWLEQPAPKSNE